MSGLSLTERMLLDTCGGIAYDHEDLPKIAAVHSIINNSGVPTLSESSLATIKENSFNFTPHPEDQSSGDQSPEQNSPQVSIRSEAPFFNAHRMWYPLQHFNQLNTITLPQPSNDEIIPTSSITISRDFTEYRFAQHSRPTCVIEFKNQSRSTCVDNSDAQEFECNEIPQEVTAERSVQSTSAFCSPNSLEDFQESSLLTSQEGNIPQKYEKHMEKCNTNALTSNNISENPATCDVNESATSESLEATIPLHHFELFCSHSTSDDFESSGDSSQTCLVCDVERALTKTETKWVQCKEECIPEVSVIYIDETRTTSNDVLGKSKQSETCTTAIMNDESQLVEYNPSSAFRKKRRFQIRKRENSQQTDLQTLSSLPERLSKQPNEKKSDRQEGNSSLEQQILPHANHPTSPQSDLPKASNASTSLNKQPSEKMFDGQEDILSLEQEMLRQTNSVDIRDLEEKISKLTKLGWRFSSALKILSKSCEISNGETSSGSNQIGSRAARENALRRLLNKEKRKRLHVQSKSTGNNGNNAGIKESLNQSKYELANFPETVTKPSQTTSRTCETDLACSSKEKLIKQEQTSQDVSCCIMSEDTDSSLTFTQKGNALCSETDDGETDHQRSKSGIDKPKPSSNITIFPSISLQTPPKHLFKNNSTLRSPWYKNISEYEGHNYCPASSSVRNSLPGIEIEQQVNDITSSEPLTEDARLQQQSGFSWASTSAAQQPVNCYSTSVLTNTGNTSLSSPNVTVQHQDCDVPLLSNTNVVQQAIDLHPFIGAHSNLSSSNITTQHQWGTLPSCTTIRTPQHTINWYPCYTIPRNIANTNMSNFVAHPQQQSLISSAFQQVQNNSWYFHNSNVTKHGRYAMSSSSPNPQQQQRYSCPNTNDTQPKQFGYPSWPYTGRFYPSIAMLQQRYNLLPGVTYGNTRVSNRYMSVSYTGNFNSDFSGTCIPYDISSENGTPTKVQNLQTDMHVDGTSQNITETSLKHTLDPKETQSEVLPTKRSRKSLTPRKLITRGDQFPAKGTEQATIVGTVEEYSSSSKPVSLGSISQTSHVQNCSPIQSRASSSTQEELNKRDATCNEAKEVNSMNTKSASEGHFTAETSLDRDQRIKKLLAKQNQLLSKISEKKEHE